MGDDMPCAPGRIHDYKLIDDQYICQRCSRVSEHKRTPTYDQLLIRNLELERFVSDYAESADTKTDFQRWAKKLTEKL